MRANLGPLFSIINILERKYVMFPDLLNDLFHKAPYSQNIIFIFNLFTLHWRLNLLYYEHWTDKRKYFYVLENIEETFIDSIYISWLVEKVISVCILWSVFKQLLLANWKDALKTYVCLLLECFLSEIYLKEI